MRLESLIIDLKAAGANQNTVRLAINCYELGREEERNELANKLQEMPLNDTANSIAIWIRSQK